MIPPLVLLFAVLSQTAHPGSSAMPKGVTRVASAGGITEFRLSNGLKVLTRVDHSSIGTTVEIRYSVGRYDERLGERGIAHLLEHLAFTGTRRHPLLRREIAAHGADVGAITGEEQTVFATTVPSTEEGIRWALEVEADRMRGLKLESGSLEAQRGIVLNEVGAGAPPLRARIRELAFDLHPYAGSAANADVPRITMADLRRFYQEHYAPDNAVLSIDGSFDDTLVIELVARLFGNLRPRQLRAASPPPEPPQSGERTVTIRDRGPPRLIAAFRVPAMSHEDFPAVELALRALTLPPRARLRAALVETGLASSVGWETRISRHPDLAFITVTATSAATLDSARNVLRKVLDDLRDRPPTDTEIDPARPVAGPRRITAGAAAECELAGDWRLCLLRETRIRATTADQVRRAATVYLVPWNRTIGVSIPGAGEIGPVTAAGDAAAIVSRLATDDTGSADGERFDPSLDNIRRRLVRARLAAGLELALLPKRTREQSVAGVLSLSFGDAHSLIGTAAAAEVVSRLLLAGTRQRTGAEIAAELRRMNATVSVTSIPRPTVATVDEFIDLTERGLPWRGVGVDVRFRTTRAHVGPLLSLLAEVLRTPALDSSEFETLRQRQLTMSESRVGLSNPDYLFAALVTGLASDHPERVADIERRRTGLARLTLAEVRAFHARFYGAGSGVLTLVGDHDPDSISAQAVLLFGNWTSPMPARPIPLARAASAVIDSAVSAYPGSSRGTILTGALLPVGSGSAEYPALVIANSILGGGVSSRLFSNLRERDGLSYSVASRLRPRVGDSVTLWSIEASYELVNATRVRDAIRREIDDALRAGFTRNEVEVARSGFLARQRLRRAGDAALADLLASAPIEELTAFEARVQRLTPAVINAVFRQFIRPDQLTTVRVTDQR